MSVLSLVQKHCRIHGLNVPGTVIGSSDYTVVQLYGILERVVEEIVTESKFNVTTYEATHTTTAALDQGPLSDIAPFGYQWIYPETLYDRTLGRPLYGPVTEQEWQAIQALPDPGPFYKYRIWKDRLYLHPAPAAPFSEIAFEYASSWAVKDATGTPKATISADSDTFVFPETILARGLAAQWKIGKGLPHQADETQYYNLLNNYISRDKVKRRYNLAEGCSQGIQPGIFVPAGNWPVA